MAKQVAVAERDPYLETLTAQIKEKDEQIRSAARKLIEEKEALVIVRDHYVKWKKSLAKSS